LIPPTFDEGSTRGREFGATGVRVHKNAGGKVTITDVPFAETQEVIGGYALLKAATKDEVVESTRRFLSVVRQGTCEIYALRDTHWTIGLSLVWSASWSSHINPLS